jgi:hypothetical protein
MPPSKIHEALEANIKQFFHGLDDSDPKVVQIIGAALLGFERMARTYHDAVHSSTLVTKPAFADCRTTICKRNREELMGLYRKIIAMRKAG